MEKIKMTLEDGLTLEGTAEDLAKLTTLLKREGIGEEAASEDVSEGEDVVKEESFEIGGYAKVVGETRFGYYGNGEIVKVVEGIDEDGEFEIFACVNYDYVKPSSLEKVELSDADKILVDNGRQPSEYKVGDIAEVLKSNSASPVGTLVEVTGKDDEFIRAKGWSAVAGRVQDSYVYTPDKLKLIALAEKRADVIE